MDFYYLVVVFVKWKKLLEYDKIKTTMRERDDQDIYRYVKMILVFNRYIKSKFNGERGNK
jgi:hypothetical protein